LYFESFVLALFFISVALVPLFFKKNKKMSIQVSIFINLHIIDLLPKGEDDLGRHLFIFIILEVRDELACCSANIGLMTEAWTT
jgi:hypothetical protein